MQSEVAPRLYFEGGACTHRAKCFRLRRADKASANSIFIFRGVAQLVARLLWEQDAAGSSPVTSTNTKGEHTAPPLCWAKIRRSWRQGRCRFASTSRSSASSLARRRECGYSQRENSVTSTLSKRKRGSTRLPLCVGRKSGEAGDKVAAGSHPPLEVLQARLQGVESVDIRNAKILSLSFIVLEKLLGIWYNGEKTLRARGQESNALLCNCVSFTAAGSSTR